MKEVFKGFLIRDWVAGDRASAANVIKTVLEEYGLGWEAGSGCCRGADQDAVEVEKKSTTSMRAVSFGS